jgi:hypothetical protein
VYTVYCTLAPMASFSCYYFLMFHECMHGIKVKISQLMCEGEIREIWKKKLLVGPGGGVDFL